MPFHGVTLPALALLSTTLHCSQLLCTALNVLRSPMRAVTCHECPPVGVDCPENVPGITLNALPIKPGFWRITPTRHPALSAGGLPAHARPRRRSRSCSMEWWASVMKQQGSGALAPGRSHRAPTRAHEHMLTSSVRRSMMVSIARDTCADDVEVAGPIDASDALSSVASGVSAGLLEASLEVVVAQAHPSSLAEEPGGEGAEGRPRRRLSFLAGMVNVTSGVPGCASKAV